MNINVSETKLLVFALVDTNGDGVTGLDDTFTVQISQNGGALAASAGTKAEIGSGYYSYELTEDETDTLGPLALLIEGTGAVPVNLVYQVVGYELSTISSGQEYCTLAEIKFRLGIDDSNDDDVLSQIIEAVSRQIDKETKRHFYTTTDDEVRYYTPKNGDVLFPKDDIISITTLKCDNDGDGVYEESWTEDTDFYLKPFNAALDDKPYTWIELAPNGSYSFPVMKKSVEITGKFGYCAIADCPAQIREACLLQCERIFKRKEAPFGIAGTPETGMLRLQSELDPDVQRMISPYKRPVL